MSLLSGKKILLASLCGWAVLSHQPAKAQIATYYDNNVIVDLSVLEDNGFRAAPSFNAPVRGSAQMPSGTVPRSAFFGRPDQSSVPLKSPNANPASRLTLPQAQPQSRIVLQNPADKPTMAAPAQPSLPTQRIAVMPSPAKPVAAPTPIIAKPKPVTPAPVQKPVETAKAAPPAPAPAAPVVTAPSQQSAAASPRVVETPAPAPAPAPAAAPSAPVVSQPLAPSVPAQKEPGLTPPKPSAPETAQKPTPPRPASEPAPRAVMAEAPPAAPADLVNPRDVTSAIKAEAEEQAATQSAALTSGTESSTRISFDPGVSQLPATATSSLSDLAEKLVANVNDRVQLLAYAGGDNLSASKARRLSLSRALAVRTYLIEQGVRSTRIDVRALGNKTTEEPLNRVDVQITPR